MKKSTFDQICSKRDKILSKSVMIDPHIGWQFIMCDVALLLQERENLRKMLEKSLEFVKPKSEYALLVKGILNE